MDDFVPAQVDGLVTVEAGRVTFRHPLVRSVVFHGERAAARRDAHRTLATVEKDPDRRAWHRSGSRRRR